MEFVGTFLLYLGLVLLIIVVHECGHLLAGWVAGIPWRDMKIRFLTFPQLVALRDGSRWVGPTDFWLYLELMRRSLPTAGRLYLYTAGGFIGETVVTTGVCAILFAIGREEIAGIVASFSLGVFTIAVFIMDLPPSWRAGHPCGDVSGLLAITKWPTVFLIVAMLAVRLALIWLAAVR